MLKTLKEVFGDIPTYMMGIAFETYTYDQDKNMNVKRKGWELPYMEVDANEIDAYASKYQVPARETGDARKTWETEEPFKDGMSGDETYYTIYVKHLDGSDIGKDEFHDINEKLKDDMSGFGTGMKVTPRPLVMGY